MWVRLERCNLWQKDHTATRRRSVQPSGAVCVVTTWCCSAVYDLHELLEAKCAVKLVAQIGYGEQEQETWILKLRMSSVIQGECNESCERWSMMPVLIFVEGTKHHHTTHNITTQHHTETETKRDIERQREKAEKKRVEKTKEERREDKTKQKRRHVEGCNLTSS